ncbi:Retrovirus-related Pol polyprotein from transposon 412 [Daphnia sinensis]|uniref:RNA-directed DNA polymerase n=1 Tax=Daphnia sinensis TaxID=1820382 RepID=A0AAD5KHP7_9CRUS|nr:Retrovirus-related Pol polyprotein from transposon 412 [Daphnia sinensis]
MGLTENRSLSPVINPSVAKITAFTSEHQLSCSESDVELYDVHNKKLFTLGLVSLPMVYGANILDQEFIVTNGISESCILGLDAADKHEFIFDGRSKTIFLARDKPEGSREVKQDSMLPTNQEPAVTRAMTLVKRVSIAPRSSQVVEATLKEQGDKLGTSSLFLFSQSMELPEGIYIGNFVNATNEKGKYEIVIENNSNIAHTLPRDSSLGKVSSGQDSTSLETVPTEGCVPETDVDVDPQYRKPLAALLNEFTDLFATKDSSLGSTGLIKHFIDTEGKGPIQLRPYRTGQGQKEELEKQIKEMLQANVIRHSTSPWAAPVILVVKKSGELRFCIDYRKLNNLTKKDSSPLPRIDSTLDRLNGKKFFTTLDLASGYWQIELEESSKEKTAFIVENNLYEFVRMPFGLCNAPATFQRLMNHILRDVAGQKALVYLDDVIIFSDSFESHLADIREVFSLIKNAGLKLKLKKCQFMKQTVNYLGHVISTNGIGPDPAKVEKLANYKVPTSAEKVRSFLGLAGYYRRFIENFGSIAQPLTAKTHKDALKKTFVWTDNDQKAFEKLRTCLITPPLLAYPNFDLEFLLFTDACDYGIGSVLSQIQDGVEKPIAYASRQLKPAEQKYATVEKEALAVVFSIKHFRHYLLDKPLTVISDHRPLQWLEEQKDNNGRLGRWAILLAGTNYRIKFRPGRVHQNADCLFRLRVAHIRTDNTHPDILESQAADPLCQEIKNYLDNGILSEEKEANMPIWAKEISLYQVTNGVLYRMETPTSKSRRNILNPQVVLPLSSFKTNAR